MNNPEEPLQDRPVRSHDAEVDKYGVPVDAFGARVPPEFFEVLGRILSVHGKIEYLQDRLRTLPSADRAGVKKVEQFFARCTTERADRNALVHSHWMFGAHTKDPDVVLAFRYKTRKRSSGKIAEVSIADVPESAHEQDVGQYTLADLRSIMRRSIVTMRIGELAYSEIMVQWALDQTSRQ